MSRFLSFATLFFAVFWLNACTTVHSSKDGIDPLVNKLEQGKSVLIVAALDGRYGNTPYPNSGVKTAQQILEQITPYTSRRHLTEQHIDLASAKQIANRENFNYIIIPTITNWEHRVAAWSGRPTRISLKIDIYEVKSSGECIQIQQKLLDSKGKSATFVSQHPEELMKELIRDFVTSSF